MEGLHAVGYFHKKISTISMLNVYGVYYVHVFIFIRISCVVACMLYCDFHIKLCCSIMLCLFKFTL
jgi:hypothetical protein